MKKDPNVDVVRRQLVQAMIGIPALTLIGCGSAASQSGSLPTTPTALTPTPACDDGDDDPTPAQTEARTSRAALRSVSRSSSQAWLERR